MSCRSIDVNKTFLDKKGFFLKDADGKFTYELVPDKIGAMEVENVRLSDLAKTRYDIQEEGTLYKVEDRSKLRDITKNSDGSVYRGPTIIQGRAIPNVELFDKVDIAKAKIEAAKINQINYSLKSINILSSPEAITVFAKGEKNGWTLEKILTELQISKEQKELILSLGISDRKQIISELESKYSFDIRTDVATEPSTKYKEDMWGGFFHANYKYWVNYTGAFMKKANFGINPKAVEITKEEYVKAYEGDTPTQHYSYLTVPGGINYTENEISTPDISPSIKGHAQFSTDKGIGWFRSDEQAKTEETRVGKAFDKGYLTEEEKEQYFEGGNTQEDLDEQLKNHKGTETRLASIGSKVRRILEVQSDLFQKGRDRKDLTGTYSENVPGVGEMVGLEEKPSQPNANKFLQLLNKDNNWVTFFVKSIVQDSAKKGYEKVLFPSGNTASKVEGHTTLEQYKKQKEDRIKELENKLESINKESSDIYTNDGRYTNVKLQLENLKAAVIPDVYSGVTKLGGLLESNISAFGFKGEIVVWKNKNIDFFSEKFAKGELENKHGVEFWILNDSLQKDLIKSSLNSLEKELESLPKEILKRERENTNNEITQLKQELERVETEGFGALKPIYTFYENTVKNILNKLYGKENIKQITDEYGNTWNELPISSEDKSEIFLQTENTNKLAPTKANTQVLDIVKVLLQKMGVSLVKLQDYAKGNPGIDTTDLNGLADLTQGVVAVAEGREDVALTEEMVHIATAILEQTNPGLITEMISKIDRFSIYKKVLEEYKKLKSYQLPNGNPDIRKIKKEAVDKLLVEVLINGLENADSFSELMEEETVSMIRQWWRNILDYLGGNYRKTNLDIFQTGAYQIKKGDFGTVEDIATEGIYAQTANSNAAVTKVFNDIINVDSAMKLNTVEEGFDRRHYTFTDAVGKVIEIAQSVTEKIEKVFKNEKREGVYLISDESKKLWGSRGHKYIMDYINTNLIDPITGFAKPFTEIPIASDFNEDITPILDQFAKGLISRYPEGTRFVIERMVKNRTNTIGSTVDFMAIEPYIKKDGTPGAKIDILDWKFTSLEKDITDDIPWYKQDDWKAQMNEYARMLVEYGVPSNDIRKARMIPFITNYADSQYGPKGTQYAESIEVGDLDNLAETKLYLLPVPIKSESTGNPEIDALVDALFVHYEKIKQKHVDTAVQKYAKKERLNALSIAIRKLQVTQNFEPLVGVGFTFVKSANSTINTLEKIDFSSLTKEELNKHLGDLLSIKNSSQKFIGINNILLEAYPDGLNPAQLLVLEGLGQLSNKTIILEKKVNALQSLISMHLGVSTGFVTEANAEILTKPERALQYLAKNFLEGTKLNAALIRLGSNLILKASSLVDITFGKKMNEFKSILIPLEKLAQSKGVTAFSLIAKMTNEGLFLKQKVDPDFILSVQNARAEKNKKFILDNIDLEAFNKEAADIMKKQEDILKEMIFDPNDAQNNDWILSVRLAKMRNSININRTTFNGWTDATFVNLINKHLKTEDNYSKEYLEMAKIPEALAMWNYFNNLNNRAKDLGYIGKDATSFMPLIEATVLQKFSATSDFGTEAIDFFKDLVTTRIDEKKSYAKIDPETHELVRKIPKYFTKTDKTPQKLSKDLGRIGALYTKALLDYESRVGLENVLLTLYEVENNKGSLNVDHDGKVVIEGKSQQTNNNAPNAPIFKAIIDDYIYGITEGAQGIALSENVKKTIENANTWTRSLGVGLKYMLGVANYFGYNFQTFIMSGGVYKYREFVKNNSAITLNKLSLEQRALIDLITPLNENVVTERMRKFTKEYSKIAYLNTWTFSDVMQVTNSFPDRLLQLANAASFNENTMVINGKLVNIRDHVRALDRKARLNMTASQRQELKKTQQARIDELKRTSSLLQIVKVTDSDVTIPGVSDEELAKYRVRVLDYGTNLNGQMNADNKASYRRNILMRGFMMFRTWIPKLVNVRVQDINYSAEQDNWEYGRMKVWWDTMHKHSLQTVSRMSHIIQGTEEGIKIMDEMLEEKRAKYYESTGQELTITNEEYYDLVQQELSRLTRELGLIVGILGLLVAGKIAEPPEDDTLLAHNKYKAWYKILAKISDELLVYYDPTTFQSVTKGSVVPSLNLLISFTKITQHLGREITGYVINDQEMIDKSYPIKYIFNIIPGPYQFQTDILPLIDPELAREMGIRVTKESRRN